MFHAAADNRRGVVPVRANGPWTEGAAFKIAVRQETCPNVRDAASDEFDIVDVNISGALQINIHRRTGGRAGGGDALPLRWRRRRIGRDSRPIGDTIVVLRWID